MTDDRLSRASHIVRYSDPRDEARFGLLNSESAPLFSACNQKRAASAAAFVKRVEKGVRDVVRRRKTTSAASSTNEELLRDSDLARAAYAAAAKHGRRELSSSSAARLAILEAVRGKPPCTALHYLFCYQSYQSVFGDRDWIATGRLQALCVLLRTVGEGPATAQWLNSVGGSPPCTCLHHLCRASRCASDLSAWVAVLSYGADVRIQNSATDPTLRLLGDDRAPGAIEDEHVNRLIQLADETGSGSVAVSRFVMNYPSVLERNPGWGMISELPGVIRAVGMGHRVLVATWSDARGRRRAGTSARSKNGVYEVLAGLPRAALLEVAQQLRGQPTR